MGDKPRTFEIGLAMAGAISAGAYSSGVLDFLFQALDAWQQEKDRNPDAVPNHAVCIKVVAGASAGSITGALGVAALGGGLQPVPHRPPPPPSDPPTQEFSYTVPALYTAWVLMPDMASPTGGPDLLDTGDLESGAPIVSLLNASLLDRIGDQALRLVREPVETPPVYGPARGGRPIPYLATPLHLYMTISNLRGVPYRISFRNSGPEKGHGMLNHGDRTHFRLDGGGMPCTSDWADADPGKGVSVCDLPVGGQPMPQEWKDYLQAALASSAFPIGLAPRQIDGSTSDYENRSWPLLRDSDHLIDPDWPEAWGAKPVTWPYPFVNVDGGMINNEPFDFAHFTLMEGGTQPNPRPAKDADRAVILVDPFPDAPKFESDNTRLDRSLVGVVKALLPTFITQARFNPAELTLALDENIYSRFLIAPRRADADGKPMKFALATGLLGGFGGFLDQSLREFDYQLGRRNCQQFLRTSFALTPDNDLIKAWSDRAMGNQAFHAPEPDGTDFGAIIPLVGSAAHEVVLPPWPRLSASRLDTIETRIIARARTLVPRLIAQQVGNRLLRAGASLLWHTFGVRAVRDYVHLAIQQDLIRRDQHADWDRAGADERSVFAALSDPAFDFRTVAGLVASTGLSGEAVAAILDRSSYPGRIYRAPRLGPGGVDAYTLTSRAPGFLMRTVGGLFRSPVFDVKS